MSATPSTSPALLPHVWNYLPGLYWVVNDALTLVAVSDDYLRLLETTRADVLHRDVAELFRHQTHTLPVGGIATLRHHLEEVHRSGREQRLTISPSSGSAPAFELVYRPVPGEHQAVTYIIGQASEQHVSEEVLRQSEVRYRALVANLPGGAVFEVNHELRYQLADGQALREVGMTPADLEGKTLWEVLDADRAQAYEVLYRQALGGQPFNLEHQDHGRHFVSRGVPLRNGDSEIYAALAVSYDITERKQAEEALRQSEEHLQLIMQSAIDYAIFTLDTDRKITRWNAGATQLTGWTEGEVLGQPGEIVFTAEDRKNDMVEKETRVATEEGHFANERWHVRRDGSQFWGSGFTVPLRTAQGQVRGFLKIMRDDTERHQTRITLQQAKESAERAARAKSDFLAHMSHEIRTPLNAVVGLAHLLAQQSDLPPTQQENLQTLRFSADSLRVLVDDILDFSKIQAGKVTIEETEVRLPELLTGLQKAHQPRADEQGTRLRFQVDPQLPDVVRTDSLKLQQVLNNLMSNAIKFTQSGEVTVSVALNRQENDDLWIDVSVQDTGIGIPSDKLTTIFDAFAQADNTTVRQFGGTGLGLSITHLLLELMESRIAVESEVGKGSRFFFTLPVKKGNEFAGPDSATVALSAPDWKRLRVLLVEDVAVNRMIFEQFLRQWGLSQLDEAANGEEAVSLVQQTLEDGHPYDLILMDVRMPVMDGYQATRAIRSLPDDAYRQVPIIALTADTVEEIKKHTESPLFTDVITKPFVPEDAHRKIIRHLSPPPAVSDLPPVRVSLKKLNKLFQKDVLSIRTFMEETIRELNDLRRKFNQALPTRDETALVNLNHKASLMLDLLALYDLKDYLRICLALVMERVATEHLEEARRRGEGMIDQAIASSEEQLRRME